MVAQAMSVGRAGNPVERAIANARTAVRGITLAPQVQYDANALTRMVVKPWRRRQDVAPADAVIARTKTGFTVNDGVDGPPGRPDRGSRRARRDPPPASTPRPTISRRAAAHDPRTRP